MSGITLETAQTVAVFLASGFGVLAIASAILLKSVAQKLALLAIFGLLAALVWTQRSSLDTCADLLRTSLSAQNQNVVCTFFGQEVTLRQ
jgi:hypothetical protein